MDSNDPVIRLVLGQPVSEEELKYSESIPRPFAIDIAMCKKLDVPAMLADICDRLHATCADCLVFELMTQAEKDKRDCPYFRNGKKMRNFILTRIISGG